MDEWTRSPREPVPDVEDAVTVLGPAFAAAAMAGRYDVEESPVAPASASFRHSKQPFKEQVRFFRDKIDQGTQSWTDIWQEEHDRAFVVAGAAHADLVGDLRQAVDSAIAEGTTIRKFRQAFDEIVAKHGWSYKGGRNWRIRVIYDTNIRSSYSAGRYRQMKDGAERRPFWRYRHSHASEDPREEHLAWDGMVLRHDDPWWDTHYPINGWGCKCYVEALNARDLKRLGKSGPDKAPPVRTRIVTVGVNGPSPRTVEVPEGIDPGFAYAPGQSTMRAAQVDPWAIGEISRADATARQLGGQAGSNPGGLYAGSDGVPRYVKFYDDPAQAYGEAVSNRAYRELGLDAPVSELVRDGDRIVGVANGIIDHSGTLGNLKGLPKGRSREVLKGFTADAWLANWDAVGLGLDNVVATRTTWKSIARIDQGGALLMRARAGRKPMERLDRIAEWDGFADAGRNPAYAKVFQAAGYGSADDLGQGALLQISAITDLGKRTDGFRRLAPDISGVADADVAAIRKLLAKRAALLESEIRPRVRAAMRAAKGMDAHQLRTKNAMGGWFAQALASGKRKVAAGAPGGNMTDPELASAYSYTTEHSGWTHYKAVNRELREADKAGRAPAKRVADYALTLNDGLDKLPDRKGTFYRGAQLTADEQAAYTVGSEHVWAGFSSTSSGKGTAFHRNTRFVVKARHGKDVRKLSAYQHEAEILLKAGTRLIVTSRRADGNVLQIEVEEIDG